MQCPVDNTQLVMSDRQGIEIDYCPQCRGVWLDRGELDKMIERSSGGGAPARPADTYNQPQQRQHQEHRGHDDDDDHDYNNRGGHNPQKPHKKEGFLGYHEGVAFGDAAHAVWQSDAFSQCAANDCLKACDTRYPPKTASTLLSESDW